MGKNVTVFSPTTGDLVLTAALLNEILGGAAGNIVNTGIATAGNGTLTAAALVGGVISRTGPTGAYSDATDTAAAIVTALGAFQLGETFTVDIKNSTAWQQTVTAGAGVTWSVASLIPPMSVGCYFGTVGGTAASPTVAFAHISTSQLHGSALVDDPQASGLATVGAGTVLAASINSGYTLRTGSTSAFTDTTDSVANILAGIGAFTGSVLGSATEWTYVNNTVAQATLQGASNVTVNGTGIIPPNSWVKYLVTLTSLTAITLTPVAQGYFPHLGTFQLNGVTSVTVSDANVTATSLITYTLKTANTVGVEPHIATITPGTGFTVVGTASDTSVYNYEIRG